VTLNPKPADAIIGEVMAYALSPEEHGILGSKALDTKFCEQLANAIEKDAEEFIQGLKCPDCKAKPSLSGEYEHEERCSYYEPMLGRDTAKLMNDLPQALGQEVIRSTAELPKVGDWYVLRFFVPMGFDIARNRKTYAFQVTMAQVQEIRQHGRDFKVLFDMETNYKEFNVQFDGDLFTRADVMAKALRDMADLVDRGSA
jgi:hypothetical protein